jgi:hypothetical protein
MDPLILRGEAVGKDVELLIADGGAADQALAES